MSFLNSETWAWVKTAPLPVVLSICLSSFVLLGSYAYSIDQEVSKQKADVAVAATQAKAAAETTKRVEEKIDKLVELVQSVVVEQAVAKAEKKAEKKKEKRDE